MPKGFSRRSLLGKGIAAGLGAALAASPAKAARWAQEVEARYPPTGRFADTARGRIHYDRRGEGPPVVLIHGASGNLRDFTFAFADRLAGAGFEAIAVDRPGHGHSDRGSARTPQLQAAMLSEAMAAIGVERPVVLGHSMGGAVAAAWAVGHEVAALVGVAAVLYPWPGGENRFHAAAASPVLGPAAAVMARKRLEEGGAENAVRWIFSPQRPPAGYAEHVGAPLAVRPATFRANGEDVSGVNEALQGMVGRYADLQVPVALVHGTADSIVPVESHAARFAREVPSARFTRLKGIGHMPHHVEASAVIDAVLQVAGR